MPCGEGPNWRDWEKSEWGLSGGRGLILSSYGKTCFFPTSLSKNTGLAERGLWMSSWDGLSFNILMN